MSYEYKIALDPDIYDQFRSILGVTAEEFTDTEIDLLPIMPAAEREVIKLVPSYATLLGTDLSYDLQLATLYFAAVNALPSLRFKLLEVETDNKTTAQRFKSALSAEPNYLQKAQKYITDINDSLASFNSNRVVFEISTPAIDAITGDAN